MKLYSVALGAGIGYLAGNQQARHKTAEFVRNLKASPQAKAMEDKVSHKVNAITEKAGLTTSTDDRTEPDVFTPGTTGRTGDAGSTPGARPSMVPH